jgi:hypothetical protein
MTHQDDYTLPQDLAEKGLETVPELLRILINQAMQAERAKYLNAGQYERTEERKGHANGYKPKTVRTRVGEITFAVPQVRESGFYPSALEKGLRSERALVIALAEMYVQGVSTRKVKAITEELCGVDVSSMQVSTGQQPNWTLPCWSGGNDHWEKSLISLWMLVTRKCGKPGKCAMRLFWWLPGSLQKVKGRF